MSNSNGRSNGSVNGGLGYHIVYRNTNWITQIISDPKSQNYIVDRSLANMLETTEIDVGGIDSDKRSEEITMEDNIILGILRVASEDYSCSREELERIVLDLNNWLITKDQFDVELRKIHKKYHINTERNPLPQVYHD